MARAIWKGTIRFEKAEVPVKLYSAVTDRRIHFRLLHAEDRVPVEQRFVDPRTGRRVPRDRLRRAYRLDGSTMVVLDESELEAIEPASSRTIEVRRFVEPRHIDHRWYDRPYWLGPDGEPSVYGALAAALGELGYEGVARWVMRKRHYAGALRASGGRLALITLRSADEVVAAEELDAPAGRAPTSGEREMARRLVDALSGDWNPEDWTDEHRERVLELVEAKREGRTVRLEDYRARPTEEAGLEEALSASLEAARATASVA